MTTALAKPQQQKQHSQIQEVTQRVVTNLMSSAMYHMFYQLTVDHME